MARPRGIKETHPRNTVARKFAAHEAEMGISPLQVLTQTMRDEWAEYECHKAIADALDSSAMKMSELSKAIGHRSEACRMAIAAAPYIHSRLASTTLNATVRTIADLSLEELAALAGAGDGEEGDGDQEEGAEQPS